MVNCPGAQREERKGRIQEWFHHSAGAKLLWFWFAWLALAFWSQKRTSQLQQVLENCFMVYIDSQTGSTSVGVHGFVFVLLQALFSLGLLSLSFTHIRLGFQKGIIMQFSSYIFLYSGCQNAEQCFVGLNRYSFFIMCTIHAGIFWSNFRIDVRFWKESIRRMVLH